MRGGSSQSLLTAAKVVCVQLCLYFFLSFLIFFSFLLFFSFLFFFFFLNPSILVTLRNHSSPGQGRSIRHKNQLPGLLRAGNHSHHALVSSFTKPASAATATALFLDSENV